MLVIDRKKSTTELPKSHNGVQVAIVGIVEVEGGVKASHMFLISK